MSILTNNTTELQEVLELLADKMTGATLPELTNEATAADLAIGKQLINSQGQIIVGTNPYAQEETEAVVEEQADLIGEIEEAVESLPDAGSGGASGVCPSLTIYGERVTSWTGMYLRKVSYYSNGVLQTLTGYDEYGTEDGLNYDLIASSYIIQNVDIGKPVVIEGDHSDHDTTIGIMSENINMIFQSTQMIAAEVAVFTITDENPAYITLQEN